MGLRASQWDRHPHASRRMTGRQAALPWWVQIGPGETRSIWLINEGQEYIKAPRWADIDIVVCMAAFFYNVAAIPKGVRHTAASNLMLPRESLAGCYVPVEVVKLTARSPAPVVRVDIPASRQTIELNATVRPPPFHEEPAWTIRFSRRACG